jgi:dTMP kinase
MKFLVIEGLDGSGKSTQIKRLKAYFQNNNIPFEYLHFPRVTSPVYGDLIARFLRGDLGKIDEVNPYLVALLFAGDRKDAASQILKWKESEKLVLVDRYVYSNIAYQCAKLYGADEQKELMKWILNVEYGEFGIPKPDFSLFLRVPLEFVGQQLESQRSGEDRDYLQGKGDIHEEDIHFQERVKSVYEIALKENDDLHVVDCGDEYGNMKSADKIFEMIIASLKLNNIVKA